MKKERIIYDTIHHISLMVLLAADQQSFFAFSITGIERPILRNDTLLLGKKHFTLNGHGIDTNYNLTPLPAYQEFWHSWRSFNPGTFKQSD